MRRLAVVLAAALLAHAAVAAAQDGAVERPEGEPDAAVAAVTAGEATHVAFGPDGTLYYSELASGNVRAIAPGREGPGDVVANVPAVPGGNGGFLGFALDPDFEETRAFFVFYTAEEGGKKVNRVSRVADGAETVLVDDLPWAEMHDGGKLAFLPDKTLLFTMGDNELRDPAQDEASPLGKVHRIHRDGSVPADNPFGDSTVYALGVRNAFGLTVDPESGRAWFSDNGPNEWDEVNELKPGANYGWPHCLGECGDDRFEAPLATWEKPFGPTGLAYFRGDLYLGDFVWGRVHRIDAATGDTSVAHTFEGEHVLSVAAGPDTVSVYAGTYERVYRLSWPDLEPLAPPPTPPSPTPEPSPEPTPDPTPSPGPSPEPSPSPGPRFTEPDEEESSRVIPAPGAFAPVAAIGLAALAALLGARSRRRP